jgi:putative transposase
MRNFTRSIDGSAGFGIPGMMAQGIAWCLPQLESPRTNHAEFVICDHTIDITYVRLLSEFVYLAVLMDVFTRGIRGWHLGRSLDSDLMLTALRRALQAGQPEIHHTDQGVQYAATAYTDLLHGAGIAISMAEVGAAWQNGFAERLMRTIKEEEVNLSEYRNYHDAYEHLGRFLDDVYMHKRIHSSLGYLTPVEFETQWLAQHAAAQPVVT